MFPAWRRVFAINNCNDECREQKLPVVFDHLFPQVYTIESARRSTPPEPERFFWEEREVLYLTPPPHPQHPAEGLPENVSEEA